MGRSDQVNGLVVVGIAVLASVGLMVKWTDIEFAPTFGVVRLYSDLLRRLDPEFPGRGPTDYPGDGDHDVPKGYAMILKAELIEGTRQSPPRVSSLARAAARFLIEHADERKDGFPGWGVPIAWDPNSDGSMNPAHTKYTISTAIVIDALLDWLEVDASAGPKRDHVLGLIRGAIAPYLGPEVLSPSGLLPYSLELVDRPYDVFNPAAYLAGVMQRFSGIVRDTELAARLRAVADKTIGVHIRYVRMARSGAWYWHYSRQEKVPNDLAHAGYIIWGLQLYSKYGGALADKLDLPAIERHLADFVDPASGALVAWPTFRKDANTPARSYDLGMGLFLVGRSGDAPMMRAYLGSVSSYRTATGTFLKYPSRSGREAQVVREYEGYVLLGLASVLNGGAR